MSKYPKSINLHQCLGPCYYKNSYSIHPVTLEPVSRNFNFCHVNPFNSLDPDTNKYIVEHTDECRVPVARKTEIHDILQNNIITPTFNFSSDYFIKVYYKIYNLEDFLNWLDTNSNDPFTTRERVFNNSMVAYGDQLHILDQRIIYFVNDLMIENISKIYKNINQYISINNNLIDIVDPESSHKQKDLKNSTNKNKEDIIIIKAYIKDKFLGFDNINQFMSKIIRYYKEDINKINISSILVNHMIDYIIKRIKLTIEQ